MKSKKSRIALYTGIICASFTATLGIWWFVDAGVAEPPAKVEPLASNIVVRGYGSEPEPELALKLGAPFGVRVSVVRGVVRSVGDDRWNTEDGKPPVGRGPGGLGTNGHFIIRTAMVDVIDVVAGPRTPNVLPVTLFGGSVGGTQMIVSEFGPELRVGEAVLLFVAPDGDGPEPLQVDWLPVLSYTLSDGLAFSHTRGPIDESTLLARIHAAVPPE